MGVKTVTITMLLGAFSVILQIIGLNLPLHTVSWFTMMLARLFRMKTYALSVSVQEDSAQFCTLVEKIKPGWCDGIYDSHDLQDIAHRMCAPIIADLVPSACLGLSRAHIAGMSLVIVTGVNVILVVISCWMFYNYINGKRKARRRILAYGLMVVAVCLEVVALAFYALLVITQLDQMQPAGGQWFSMLLSANKGTGVSSGFMVLTIACGVQIVMLVVSSYAASGDEWTDEMIEDEKMQKEINSEWEKAHMEYGLPLNPAQPTVPGYGAVGYGGNAAQAVPGPQSYSVPYPAAETSSFGLPPAHAGNQYSGW